MRRGWLAAANIAFLALGAAISYAGTTIVVFAAATSTQDTGLLDLLVPAFEKKTGYTVRTIPVGTGQGLTMGVRGEADVVLTHSPELELKYVGDGSLVNRRLVMYNDFVLVGPPTDPAGIKGMKSASDALKKIAEHQARFVSRADHSGTHEEELALWIAAGITPKGRWYIESGQGQGTTLTLASEKEAYALVDRGTYLGFQKRVRLAILLEGDPRLFNVYHVMEANAARNPKVNAQGGKALADFIVSPEGQEIIKTLGMKEYGQPLFFPSAGKPEPGATNRRF